MAMLDLADLDADDGNLADALALYDRVLKKVPGHRIALLGNALARAEADFEADPVLEEVNAKQTYGTPERELEELGPRVIAYRDLAFALANCDTDRFDDAIKQEQKA